MGLGSFLFGGPDQRAIDKERARALGQSNRFTDYAYGRLGDVEARGDRAYGEGYGAYRNLLDPNFVDSNIFGRGREGAAGPGGGSGGGGGAAAAAKDPYGDMFNSSEDLAGRFRDFKGIDPEALRYFREYATTGGWSPERRADAMAESTAGVPAVYGNLINDINRRGAVTGSGLVDGSVARLARESARAATDAARSGRLGIEQAVDTGRQWGATGIEGHHTNDAQARLQALGGEGNVLASILGNKVSMRNTDEQVAASRAASGAANSLAEAQLRANLYLGGAGGMSHYFDSDVGTQSDLRGNILGNNQMTGNQMGGLIQQSNKPEALNTIAGLGGAAMPWINMFSGPRRQTSSFQGFRNPGSSSAQGGVFGAF